MQPFFVPYSSQVCSADVQTVEEPSPDSKTSIFLYLLCLFVALVSFACRRRIVAPPRSWPIIGFLVLLSVGGVYAINGSAITVDIGWFMDFLRENRIVISVCFGFLALVIIVWASLTCIDYWRERLNRNNNNNNRNAVHPQVNVGYNASTDDVRIEDMRWNSTD